MAAAAAMATVRPATAAPTIPPEPTAALGAHEQDTDIGSENALWSWRATRNALDGASGARLTTALVFILPPRSVTGICPVGAQASLRTAGQAVWVRCAVNPATSNMYISKRSFTSGLRWSRFKQLSATQRCSSWWVERRCSPLPGAPLAAMARLLPAT